MKVPKTIEKELSKRGWIFSEGERWRYVKGMDWACAYFYYRKRVCLITVAKSMLEYHIQILYANPVCSQYIYSNKQFNVKLNTNGNTQTSYSTKPRSN